MNNSPLEVIIIGGGPAGMSAALVLGRSRIKTLVLNTETPRNAITRHSHGFLTQDGIHPTEIFAVAKQQLDKYPSVSYKKQAAIRLERLAEGFQITTAEGSYTTRKVILATGYKDDIAKEEIPGLTKVYGQSVFPCPFCDGFEMADKPLAVFGDGTMGPLFAKKIAYWSKDLHVFTNGESVTDPETSKQLEAKGIQIIETKIEALREENGILKAVVLADGTEVLREGGFLAETHSTENVAFAKELNIPTEEGPFGMVNYIVDENKESSVKGFYIIGDARTGWSGVTSSVAEGSEVGKAITHQLIEEFWD